MISLLGKCRTMGLVLLAKSLLFHLKKEDLLAPEGKAFLKWCRYYRVRNRNKKRRNCNDEVFITFFSIAIVDKI